MSYRHIADLIYEPVTANRDEHQSNPMGTRVSCESRGHLLVGRPRVQIACWTDLIRYLGPWYATERRG